MHGISLLRRVVAAGCWPYGRLNTLLRPGLRVLMYHRICANAGEDQLAVTPARFRRQMEYLARRHRVISLHQAVAQLGGKSAAAGVALTFDDGYHDNLVNALPVLRDFGLPATIFVTTSFCSQERIHPRYPQGNGRLHLDWSEVKGLSREPGITIGSHTCSHPFLTRISDDAAAREITESRSTIEAQIGTRVDLFCYPSGDMGCREENLVQAAGYRAAVTVSPGLNRPGQSAFALRRTEVTERDGETEFAMKLQGAFDPVHEVLHRRRQRAFSRQAWQANEGSGSR